MGAYKVGQERDQAYASAYDACMAPPEAPLPGGGTVSSRGDTEPEAYWP